MSKILGNICIDSVLLAGFVKSTSHRSSKPFVYGTVCFWYLLKILETFEEKSLKFFLYFYFFCLKNSRTGCRKTSITRDWLVADNCLTPRWIEFLMFYRLAYNIPSHFNDLMLAWSAYLRLWEKVSRQKSM